MGMILGRAACAGSLQTLVMSVVSWEPTLTEAAMPKHQVEPLAVLLSR